MSIQKLHVPDKGVCLVVFSVPNTVVENIEKIALVGDFNNWDQKANLMKKTRKGDYTCKVELSVGTNYQFRYLINESNWVNEQDADGYSETPYPETLNSIVSL